jgi:hypothetical protein
MKTYSDYLLNSPANHISLIHPLHPGDAVAAKQIHRNQQALRFGQSARRRTPFFVHTIGIL